LKTNPITQQSEHIANRSIVAVRNQRFEYLAGLFKEVRIGNSTFKCIGFNDSGVKHDQNGVNTDELKRRVAKVNENNSKFKIVGVKYLGLDVYNA
jgi:hypothetical protein